MRARRGRYRETRGVVFVMMFMIDPNGIAQGHVLVGAPPPVNKYSGFPWWTV